MEEVRLTHESVAGTITVPSGAARVLKKSGWKEEPESDGFGNTGLAGTGGDDEIEE